MLERDPFNSPVRLGAISFINTIPIYLPFEADAYTELIYRSPARLNRMMDAGELDISPVSSAYYLQHQQDLVLMENLSVSSPGAVESVIFISKEPIGRGLLDMPAINVPDDSETSVMLLAYLLKEETGEDLTPWFRTYAAGDYRQQLANTGNALVIGDHALLIHEAGIPEGYYCYDLSTLWREQTGLPFVFAVWAARREWAENHPARYIQISKRLQDARERFFSQPENVRKGVEAAQSKCRIPEETIRRYFTRALNYELGQAHLQSLIRFKQAILSFSKQDTRHERVIA